MQNTKMYAVQELKFVLSVKDQLWSGISLLIKIDVKGEGKKELKFHKISIVNIEEMILKDR